MAYSIIWKILWLEVGKCFDCHAWREIYWFCRVLDTKSIKKHHTLLVTALYRCAIFLAGECISFDSGLVREFCQKTLTECLQSSTDCFQNVCCNHFFFFCPDLYLSCCLFYIIWASVWKFWCYVLGFNIQIADFAQHL